MVTTNKVALTTALDIEQFHDLSSKIAGLPDADSFQERVENDLWQTITGDPEYNDDSIEYNALPDSSKAVIGYTADDEIPWWFHSFSWSATSHGEKITFEKTNTEDSLAQFEEFDPQNTTLHKPTLQAGADDVEENIVSVLKAFEDLYEELPDKIKTGAEISETRLPNRIFDLNEGEIRTTGEFKKEWFQTLIQLSPPLNDSLTALLVSDVGVEREGVKDIISDSLINCLDEIGLGECKISNRYYRKHLRKVLALNGVFDLELPQAKQYDELGGLETMFYEMCEQKIDLDEEAVEWINKASKNYPEDLESGRQGTFVESVFELPVRLEKGQVCYTTLRVTSNESRYYKSDQRKRKEINEIMNKNGLLE